MSNFVDDDSQGQNERHVLTFFNFDTVLVANGEELLRDRGHQVVLFLDLELSRTVVAFDLECALFGFHGEFLSTDQIQFTASEGEISRCPRHRDKSLPDIGNDFILLANFILRETQWIDDMFD